MQTLAYDIAISKEAIAEMPLVEYTNPIIVVDTPQQAREALEYLSQQEYVGFDTETRPNFRKGQNHQVALVQIATSEKTFLFRICRFGLITELLQFFESKSVTKIGLSLKDDFHNLHKFAEFHPEGFVELQEIVRAYAITDASLQKIFGILFGHRISKGQRLTNWEAEALTQAQQTYAAIDAWACLQIYHKLTSGQFDPESSPYKVMRTPTES